MENMDSIYTDIIMEASTSKHNKHNLTNPDFIEHGHNPSCGDDITLEIKMKDDILEDISFTGTGCAISQASTTIMIDLFKGKTKQAVLKLIDIYLRMIKREKISDEEIDSLEDAAALQNISNMPARVKCAELAWYTMQKILNK